MQIAVGCNESCFAVWGERTFERLPDDIANCFEKTFHLTRCRRVTIALSHEINVVRHERRNFRSWPEIDPGGFLSLYQNDRAEALLNQVQSAEVSSITHELDQRAVHRKRFGNFFGRSNFLLLRTGKGHSENAKLSLRSFELLILDNTERGIANHFFWSKSLFRWVNRLRTSTERLDLKIPQLLSPRRHAGVATPRESSL